MKLYFDVGGTNISIYCKKKGTFTFINEIDTLVNSFQNQIDLLLSHIPFEEDPNLHFALPGVVSANGDVSLTNIDYKGNFKDFIQSNFFPKHLTLMNDADAFTYGVSRILNDKLVCGVIFGTGIGVGLVNSGNLVESKRGGFGEIGMMLENQFNSKKVEEYIKSKGYSFNNLESFNFNDINKIKSDLKPIYIHIKKIFTFIDFIYSPDVIAISGSFSKFIKFLFSIFNYYHDCEIHYFPSKYTIYGLDVYNSSIL